MIPRRLLLASGLAAPAATRAQAPRPISIVVPTAPGGSTDVLGRIVAQAMAPSLGVPVLIENLAGAGGLLGVQRVSRAAPDGQTIVFANMATLIAAAPLYPSRNYDPRRDLAPIGVAASNPMVLAVRRGGAANLAALLDELRRRGPAINIATAGAASGMHLAAALLLNLTGTQATLIAYRGGGPAMNDLAAGVVDALLDQSLSVIPAHQGGLVLALATSAPRRLPQLPDVPTFAEAGLPTFDMAVWSALAAPPGTPTLAIARIAEALDSALDDSNLRQRMEALAAEPTPPANRGPVAMSDLVKAEFARWSRIIEATGMRVE